MSDELPVPKISQSLDVSKEDFLDFDLIKAGSKRSKSKKHNHIDFYYKKSFVKDYFSWLCYYKNEIKIIIHNNILWKVLRN